MSEIKHPMSVLYGLFHENVKKFNGNERKMNGHERKMNGNERK